MLICEQVKGSQRSKSSRARGYREPRGEPISRQHREYRFKREDLIKAGLMACHCGRVVLNSQGLLNHQLRYNCQWGRSRATTSSVGSSSVSSLPTHPDPTLALAMHHPHRYQASPPHHTATTRTLLPPHHCPAFLPHHVVTSYQGSTAQGFGELTSYNVSNIPEESGE
jgi:hypothetical protein